MCVVSFVGDQYTRRIPEDYPWVQPFVTDRTVTVFPPSREEFDALREEVREMREDLRRAKELDIADGNPDCEMDEKVELLKRVAELVGVDLSEIFG